MDLDDDELKETRKIYDVNRIAEIRKKPLASLDINDLRIRCSYYEQYAEILENRLEKSQKHKNTEFDSERDLDI